MHEDSNVCPRCGSSQTSTIDVLGYSCLACEACGYDDTELCKRL